MFITEKNMKKTAERMLLIILAVFLCCISGECSSPNAVISRETAVKMQQIISEKGMPVMVSGYAGDMMNYDVMEGFLDEALSGNQAEAVLYRIHTDGTVSREKFTFDGEDMYSFYTKSRWTDRRA